MLLMLLLLLLLMLLLLMMMMLLLLLLRAPSLECDSHIVRKQLGGAVQVTRARVADMENMSIAKQLRVIMM